MTKLTPSAQCIEFMMLTLSSDAMDASEKYCIHMQVQLFGLYYHLKNSSTIYRLCNILKLESNPNVSVAKTIFDIDVTSNLELEYNKNFLNVYFGEQYDEVIDYDIKKQEIYNNWKQNILSNREKETILNCESILELPNNIISHIGEYI